MEGLKMPLLWTTPRPESLPKELNEISRIKHCAEQNWDVGASQIRNFTLDVKVLLEEYERLRRVEEDLRNILKAALYFEKDGVSLVNRLTTYAISYRLTQ
jgi:hypothetical protein